MSFIDKVVLVTGGISGIGEATAIAFAKEGARVIIADRNESNSAELNTDNILVLRVDISDESQAAGALQHTINKFGKLDILINNAGVLKQASLLKGNILHVYDEVMATNLRAAIHLTSIAAPHLIKTKGNVINISSIGGVIPIKVPTLMSYCVSKAGLNHFTKAAALELAPYGVRVNAISPGLVNTNIIESDFGPIEELQAMAALNRMSEPDEIADLVLFLASDKAKSITGSNYVCDNGVLIK